MIGRPDIVERVAEWQLTEEVVEKDYVLGWLLWGIGADSVLGDQWVFKGGTCLKKCYIETYRFSEDLDFTVLPGGPYRPEQIEPLRSWRRIEPYSLRRSSAGRLLLHAERSDGTGHRTYSIDKIGGIRATTTPFRPRYPIEFSAQGPLHAPAQSRTPPRRPTSVGMTRSRARIGPVYVYQCTRCGKELRHTKRNSTLRAHKDPYGYPCRGRRGIYLGTRQLS